MNLPREINSGAVRRPGVRMARGPAVDVIELGVDRLKAGVTGGRGEVTKPEEFFEQLRKLGDELGVALQAFNARVIAGRVHLVHAAREAGLAIRSGKTFARSRELELLCWVAAERQIARAVERVGVKRGVREIALLSVGEQGSSIRLSLTRALELAGLTPDPSVLELKPSKVRPIRKAFDIGVRELRTVPLQSLILERIALLATL
jgi:KEOPS complex subunit Cgi121